MFKKITLSSAPFYASLVVITSLATFIGSFWAVNEYQAYKESVEVIKSNYKHQYESRLKEELGKVVELISHLQMQNNLRVEHDLRERVQAAYTIASHNYRLYKDDKSPDELRSMVIELLRPMRWNNGRGYYFLGRVNEGVIDLFADEPFFEGKTAAEFQALIGQDVVGNITSVVRDKEAGLVRYNLTKPLFTTEQLSKIAFVKYFQPLDWFIGAGIYSNDLEENLQREVLGRIQNIRFGADGEVFCLRADGTIISNQDERLIGRSVRDLVDHNGLEYGMAFLEAGLKKKQAEYVHYAVADSVQGVVHQKLAYVTGYENWGWVVGTSMFMDSMEQAIAYETETYQRIAFKNVLTFIVLFAIAVVFLLASTFYYSLKIKQGISLFTNFFQKAADSNVKISKKNLTFREFEDLGRLANRMVEYRINNEMLLHRDELRLDSLLKLGMMDKQSLQDKYRFILQRIAQITRSREGYLAVVNPDQTHITLCARLVSDEGGYKLVEVPEVSTPVHQSGFPGQAVVGKTALVENDFPEEMKENTYPYRVDIKRHLDVPIYNDGVIVMVAGVCNNRENYDNADIRQVTLLLEGLWMHCQKKSAEEELARLERQIIAVSEEERSKIGRDLHDDLGSHLTGVELLSKALQQNLREEAPERAEQLGTIRSLILDAIEKTRRLSQGLYPVHVVEYGLEAAIEELIAEVKKMFKIHFDLSWQDGGKVLGKNTATHLHYIIREAVFNAARHGKPNNIGVYMRHDDSGFSVKIVDDGKGFAGTPAATGMGFHTMQYRAKAIGATLVINSGEKSGTIISVSGEGLE
ncbi:MAG: cache domain-containing protein [Desulforhopalus sp.]|nr:cache domain-containing protein [Desulforhopalus sp.]